MAAQAPAQPPTQPIPASAPAGAGAVLASSAAKPVPADASILWLVPPLRADASTAATARASSRAEKTAAASKARMAARPEPPSPAGARALAAGGVELAEGIRLYAEGKAAQALAKLSSPTLAGSELAGYAVYYAALARMALQQPDQARAALAALRARQPQGYLAEAAAVKEAEAAGALGDHHAAEQLYDELTKARTTSPDDVWLRLARSAQAAGDRELAARALLRVYYEFPFSDLATVAETELEQFQDLPSVGDRAARYKLELGRSERLFGGKRYAQAQAAFEAIRSLASGDERELVDLRIAECDFYLRRYTNARDEARPYIDHASRRAEALFFYLSSLRALDDNDEYVRLSRQLVDTFPTSSWAEDTLNNLGTYYILQDDDDKADATFRELYTRFPRGRYAERAAWKAGWWAYRQGRYRDAIRIFEDAAAAFPHADTRPAWLYWIGKAYDKLGDQQTASARFRLTVADYRNTYYGRLASEHVSAPAARRAVLDVEGGEPPDPPQAPPTAALIRELISLELYDQAANELNYAERAWGESPVTRATLAWLYNRQGDLRRGINTMRRAYPQFMAEGGEKLPVDLLKIIFPVDYWKEIRQQSEKYNLDPYLLAALIAQESTFGADARSAANAIGLMQIVPSTGRWYARRLRIGRFTPALLTRPDINLRIGVAFFADLVKRFGGVHYALASYNAGENRVIEWMGKNGGLDRDEFIDDIPFPETQNYVKRILGTAEDYRRLYAGVMSATAPRPKPAPKAPAVRKPTRKKSGKKA